MIYRVAFLASASAAALFFGASAQAQDASTSSTNAAPAGAQAAEQPVGVEEVIVTALKRTESVQAAPAAITAFSGAGLAERGISNIEGLQFAVPSVQAGGLLGETQIAIRGIGNGPGGPSTAIYVDGVYQPIAALADLTAVDVARVEVLRGPQGTLYGRNANGGAVNFISNAPIQDVGGYVSALYESFDEYRLQAMANVPLTSSIAARAALNYDDRREGFIENVTPGAPDLDRGRVFSGRFRIGGDISEDLSFDLNLQGKHAEGPFQYYSLRTPDAFVTGSGGVVPTAPWKTSATGPADTNENYGLGAFTLDWNSPIGALKSITAFQRYNITALTDQDATNAQIFDSHYRLLDRTFTQEVNLNARLGPVDSILGAFYMNERGQRHQTYTYGFAGGLTGSYEKNPQNVESRAVYADLTWNLSDRFRLIGGLRYSEDQQTYRINQVDPVLGSQPVVNTCPTAETDLQFDSTTGKVGAQYDVAQHQNVYGTVSTGYLSGGLNELSCPTRNSYQPETITSYEVGYKSRLFDNHLTFNVAAFFYDFTDLQISQLTTGAKRIVTNAGASSVKGLEVETNWVPDAHWTLGFNATYLDATYDSFSTVDVLTLVPFDAAGNRLNNSPRFSGNVSMAYRTDTHDWGGLVFRADASARSRVFFRPTNQPADAQAGYGLLNLSAIWNAPGDAYSVRLFDDNVFNTPYLVTLDAAGGVGRYITYGTPNQVGIEVKARF